MQTNIEAAGQSLPDGQTMKVNFSNVEANVNKDGNLTSLHSELMQNMQE